MYILYINLWIIVDYTIIQCTTHHWIINKIEQWIQYMIKSQLNTRQPHARAIVLQQWIVHDSEGTTQNNTFIIQNNTFHNILRQWARHSADLSRHKYNFNRRKSKKPRTFPTRLNRILLQHRCAFVARALFTDFYCKSAYL